MWIIVRRILSLVSMIASIGMLAWGLIPAGRQKLVQLIDPVMLSEVDGGPKTIVVTQGYQVVLEWPNRLRIGDMAIITLTFEPSPTQANSPASNSDAISVYTSNNLMTESSYETAGLQVTPAVPTRESLPPGKSVKQIWQLSTQQAGAYRGIVWLSLRILPLSGGEPSTMPIFIHEVDVHAASLFGLSGAMARLWGSICFIVGLGLSYDVLIGRIRNKKTTKDTKDTKEI